MSNETDYLTALRLLIVDDDVLQANIIQKIGSQLNFDVTIAHSAEAAIDLVSITDFSHITVDLALGDRDGVELLRAIASGDHVPNVVVISGCDQRILTSVLRMARESGLSDAKALAKPINLALLHEILAHSDRAGTVRKSDPRLQNAVGAAHLRQAISDQEIYPVFQPKIDLSTGRLIGCEALARWQSLELGRVPPDRFIPAAERLGFIRPMTLLMLDRSISEVRGMIARDPEFVVAVNLSAVLLSDLSIPDEIDKILSKYNVSARSLMIEVTESTAMSDLSRATDVLLRLRIKGVSLSIDDFGTGYSSLSVLARMPFNELKIDRSFVRHCLTDQDMWKVIRGSIVLAHEFGMKVVAEGIEDRKTCEALNEIGCDIGQGFLFSPGLPKAEFDEWSLNWASESMAPSRRFG